MLQLSRSLPNGLVKFLPVSSWRVSTQQLIAACSGAANPSQVLVKPKVEGTHSRKPKSTTKDRIRSNNPMIQAAFDLLRKHKSNPENKNAPIELEIRSNSTVAELLKIAEGKDVSRENAEIIIALLKDWVNEGKVKLSDFELDERFLYLCQLFSASKKKSSEASPGRQGPTKYVNTIRVSDLTMFYNVDEIGNVTKDISSMPVDQMVKVMAGLAQQKRRTTPLLRCLAFNISTNCDVLNVKQLSDLLYSISVLNFPDEKLLDKIGVDLIKAMDTLYNSPIIGSLLTSIGMLRYKNVKLMNKVSEWVVKKSNEIRPQDLCSFFMTLAVLGFTPGNVDTLKEVFAQEIKECDMTKPSEWLDIVWAFTVLQLADTRHITSVLDSKFLAKLTDENQIPLPKRHKLLNINGAAKLLMKNYDGNLLSEGSSVFSAPIQRSKEKENYVKSVNVTLENLFPLPGFLKTNVDTEMGFLLDAEFFIDTKGKPLPLTSDLSTVKGYRIATLSLCYSDFCRGQQNPLGYYDLYCRLLHKKGYQILTIPHTEFIAGDSIGERITYINNRINNFAK